ncbi:MAG: hypothetical protein A2015_04635 [Spirochaetes bacterium GWF1_31_7]|nr:MAG: hypothetical protein A2Y30_05015 [Spirochaetes bacterium GWE1_32_154]OHD48756.1 MAG: hypothetical protein A2Y29_02990 [Spirochaetes bacterium GWE2_31_10]OHD52819.1 MAG: hypothetical protein A2015_04635 [Spirochaetes bacterium GWF1_31_7]
MFNKNSIPATMIFSIVLISMYGLNILNPTGFHTIFVLKNALVDFYPWQIITYIFNDATSVLYYFFKVLIIFWFCSILESEWGTKHFSIFLLSGILAKSITALAINYFIPIIPFESLLNGYGSMLSPNSLMLTLMTAFGFIYPDQKIYLFFILPVRIKLISIISLAIAAIQLIMIFTTGNPLFISSLLAIIYLSGFLGLFIYFRRIFGSSIVLAKMKNPTHLHKYYSRKPVTSEKIKNTAEKRDISTMPLCEESDFDENDHYCKECDLLPRCITRKTETDK